MWFPKIPTGIEIIALVDVGFTGNVRDLALIPAILSRVFPKSGRSSNGDLCPTTPDRCVAAADSQTETETRRSPCLGRSISILVSMAFSALDRETSYCYRLAPSRVPLVLDLEDSTWTPRTSMRSERNTRIDSDFKPRQCGLGSAANS